MKERERNVRDRRTSTGKSASAGSAMERTFAESRVSGTRGEVDRRRRRDRTGTETRREVEAWSR